MSIDITGTGTCPRCNSIYVARSTSPDVPYSKCLECGHEWMDET